MSPLIQNLKVLRRRIFARRWLHNLVNAFLLTASVACIWLLISKCFPTLGNPTPITLAIVGLGLLGGSVFTWLRRPSLMHVALEADEQLGLRERITSSLELQDKAIGSAAMVEAVHNDAAAHVEQLKDPKTFAIRPPHRLRYCAIPIILYGLGYLFLPELDLFGYQEREVAAKVAEAQQLKRAKPLTRAVMALKAPELDTAALEETKLQLESLLAGLKKGDLNDKQALARVQKLSQKLGEHRNKLQQAAQSPKMNPAGINKLDHTKALAKALQQGKMGDAKKALDALKKKMEDPAKSPEEKKKLAEEMKKLSSMLEQDNSQLSKALAEALAKAAESMGKGEMSESLKELENLELSLADLESALAQMAKLDAAMGEFGEWQQATFGESEFCRFCGKKLKPCKNPGTCKGGACKGDHSCYGSCSGGSCAGSGNGPGMGGAGRGAGNRVGELPDVEAMLQPSVAPGSMTKGKMLATILQNSAPETDVEAEIQYMEGSFTSVRQQAENALTQEKIPAGAKAYVREYFGSIDPDAEQ